MIELIKTYKAWILISIFLIALALCAIAIRNIFFVGGKPIDCNKPGVCPDLEFPQ